MRNIAEFRFTAVYLSTFFKKEMVDFNVTVLALVGGGVILNLSLPAAIFISTWEGGIIGASNELFGETHIIMPKNNSE